jgi:hypothetical protein
MYSATPPIHHPVPQRPVQVPVMQSPPPPSQSSDPYDNPYGGYGSGAQAHTYPQQGAYPQNHAPQPGGNNAYGQQFGAFAQGASFFNDPMAAPMAFNMARAAMGGSTEMAEKNVRFQVFQVLTGFFKLYRRASVGLFSRYQTLSEAFGHYRTLSDFVRLCRALSGFAGI